MKTKQELYEEIENELKEHKNSFILSKKAYLFADKMHISQTRKDGTPYIYHPLEVALILAKLGFEDKVIATALLHDVVEDCGVTVSKVDELFGYEIAELVDTVSAIDKEDYSYSEDEIFESEDFNKFSRTERSQKKLLSLGKKNPLSFYVKFADRLHNLTTISVFPYSKQMDKVRETERWILPLTKIVGSDYFFREIKSKCFEIINRNDAEFFATYQEFATSVLPYVQQVKQKYQKLFTSKYMPVEIVVDIMKNFEVAEEVLNIRKIPLSKISAGQIGKLPVYRFYLIFKNSTSNEEFIKAMANIYPAFSDSFKVINVNVWEEGKMCSIFTIDNIHNLYEIIPVTQKDYQLKEYGSEQGFNTDLIDEENTHDVETNYMKILTRSNQPIFLPQNSTALDFAFKIHSDIGYAFKCARINDAETEYPPYTKLRHGDKVEVMVNKDENGFHILRPQLKWLAYVQTENAKKSLIKYFEKKIN